MSKDKRQIVLLGEGVHQHTLVGQFEVKGDEDFRTVNIEKETDLIHEHPSGSFGQHYTLKLDKGTWQQGLQVEYNPFENRVTRVWD